MALITIVPQQTITDHHCSSMANHWSPLFPNHQSLIIIVPQKPITNRHCSPTTNHWSPTDHQFPLFVPPSHILFFALNALLCYKIKLFNPQQFSFLFVNWCDAMTSSSGDFRSMYAFSPDTSWQDCSCTYKVFLIWHSSAMISIIFLNILY